MQHTVRRIGSVLLFCGLCSVLQAGAALAELYRCETADGEIFTNKEGLPNCKEYTPRSALGVLPAPQPAPRTGSTPPDGDPYDGSPAPPRQDRYDERRLPGQISFETFRMLSTGMTETEVLVRAGYPRHKFRLSIGTVVWAYANDDWIVEVTFSGGRVADINRYRPRP